MSSSPILCATDFSEDATHALRRAAMLAEAHGAALAVLHVVPEDSLAALRQWIPDPVDLGERLVRAVRQQLDGCADEARRSGVRVEPEVVIGDVTGTILARSASAGMLVVGAHGTNPLRDFLLGTTAERIAGRCEKPVLVVRTPPEGAYRRAIAALDLLPGSEAVLGEALRLAPDATLIAAHAFDVPYEGALHRAGVAQALVDKEHARARTAALEQIGGLSRAAAGDAGRVVAFAERGHAAATILDLQRKQGADLIVIRKRARPLAEAVLLGSVTRHVLADATSDVLLLAEPQR